MTSVEEMVEQQLRAAGLSDEPAEYDSDIHSWRCRYPDRYGPCGCFAELIGDLTAVVAARLAGQYDEARREALVDVARKVERLMYANPMNGDGHNYALDKVQQLLSRLGDEPVATAIRDERAAIEAERAESQARLDERNAENARGRAARIGES